MTHAFAYIGSKLPQRLKAVGLASAHAFGFAKRPPAGPSAGVLRTDPPGAKGAAAPFGNPRRLRRGLPVRQASPPNALGHRPTAFGRPQPLGSVTWRNAASPFGWLARIASRRSYQPKGSPSAYRVRSCTRLASLPSGLVGLPGRQASFGHSVDGWLRLVHSLRIELAGSLRRACSARLRYQLDRPTFASLTPATTPLAGTLPSAGPVTGLTTFDDPPNGGCPTSGWAFTAGGPSRR